MNKFEVKALECEVLSEVYKDVERHIEWLMDYDEDGVTKILPSNEWAVTKIELFKNILKLLEKQL